MHRWVAVRRTKQAPRPRATDLLFDVGPERHCCRPARRSAARNLQLREAAPTPQICWHSANSWQTGLRWDVLHVKKHQPNGRICRSIGAGSTRSGAIRRLPCRSCANQKRRPRPGAPVHCHVWRCCCRRRPPVDSDLDLHDEPVNRPVRSQFATTRTWSEMIRGKSATPPRSGRVARRLEIHFAVPAAGGEPGRVVDAGAPHRTSCGLNQPAPKGVQGHGTTRIRRGARTGRLASKDGHKSEFVAAWLQFDCYISRLPHSPGTRTLLPSVDVPQQFYLFGPWRCTLDDIRETGTTRDSDGDRQADGSLRRRTTRDVSDHRPHVTCAHLMIGTAHMVGAEMLRRCVDSAIGALRSCTEEATELRWGPALSSRAIRYVERRLITDG